MQLKRQVLIRSGIFFRQRYALPLRTTGQDQPGQQQDARMANPPRFRPFLFDTSWNNPARTLTLHKSQAGCHRFRPIISDLV